MVIISNIWVNSILLVVLIASLYLLISRIKLSNVMKILFSVLSVVIVFMLIIANAYSWWQLDKKKNSFKYIKPSIMEVQNLTDFEADKYLVNIAISPDLNKNQIRKIIVETNDFIREEKKDASIIWLTFFDKELPKEEQRARKDNPHYMCQTQWVDKDYVGFISTDFQVDETYKEIEISWKK